MNATVANLFKDKFYEVYAQQPESLTHLGKLIRLDKLTNLEVEKEISVCLDLTPRWYFSLSTIITQEYFRLVPSLGEFQYLEELVLEQLLIYTSAYKNSQNSLTLKDLTLRYIQRRKALVKFLQERKY